ncbi:hypothetical protein ASPCAL04277 [Aspergillus calidoustus]|uniref:Uncharacterized protein n=1 Tax=Aspergillus calidoustus TaxID=454130 RepID=A0A0U5FUE8_ASPCI|nr:hypothetical protein ASPCAL04277 [Aspergillus calidoustus]
MLSTIPLLFTLTLLSATATAAPTPQSAEQGEPIIMGKNCPDRESLCHELCHTYTQTSRDICYDSCYTDYAIDCGDVYETDAQAPNRPEPSPPQDGPASDP